jgi:hypothetical protein
MRFFLWKFCLAVFCYYFVTHTNCYANYTAKINLKVYGFYSNKNDDITKLLIDSNIKSKYIFSDSVFETAGIISLTPLQLNFFRRRWDFIPEYYFYTKNQSFGQLYIGKHISLVDNLRVDITSMGIEHDIELIPTMYEKVWPSYVVANVTAMPGLHSNKKSLFLNQYTPKISYLSPIIKNKVYFAATYIPQYPSQSYIGSNDIWYGDIKKYQKKIQNLTQVGLYCGDSISKTIYKTSLNLEMAKNFYDWNAGINIKYLGLLIGGSYGSSNRKNNYYTAGIGYAIGPFKTSLTHMHSTNEFRMLNNQTANTNFTSNMFGIQYKIIRGITSHLEIGNISLLIRDKIINKQTKIPSIGIICGIKFSDS